MSIVYQIVKSHRGITEIRSEQKKGTTFLLRLPSCALPGHLEWTQQHAVGIPTIDKQHLRCLSLLNSLHLVMMGEKSRKAASDILIDLQDHLVEHFKHEEVLFLQTQYPEREQHKQLHDAFLEKFVAMTCKIKDPTALPTLDEEELVRNWLREHILSADHKYATHLMQYGIV